MIYFVQPEEGGYVKIGTTQRLRARVRELEKEYDVKLTVLAVLPGDKEAETLLHKRFSHIRSEGEWFEPDSDLLEFIASDGLEWDGEDENPHSHIRLPGDVVELARIASAFRGESQGKLVGNILRPILQRIVDEEHAKRARRKGDA